MTVYALKYDDPHVKATITGAKDTTVRYDDERGIRTDDTIICVTTEGDIFAQVEVDSVFVGTVEAVVTLLDATDWSHPNTTTDGMVRALNRYYTDPITPQTTVKLLHYTEVQEFTH